MENEIQIEEQPLDRSTKAAQDFINLMHEQNKLNGWIKYIQPKTSSKPLVVRRSFGFWLLCFFSSKYRAIYRAYEFFESQLQQSGRGDLKLDLNSSSIRFELRNTKINSSDITAIQPEAFTHLMEELYAIDGVVKTAGLKNDSVDQENSVDQKNKPSKVKMIPEFKLTTQSSKKTIPGQFFNILINAHNAPAHQEPQSGLNNHQANSNPSFHQNVGKVNLVLNSEKKTKNHEQTYGNVIGQLKQSQSGNNDSQPKQLSKPIINFQESPIIIKENDFQVKETLLGFWKNFNQKSLQEFLNQKLNASHCQDHAQVIVDVLGQVEQRKFAASDNELTFLRLCYQRFRDLASSSTQATKAENLIKEKVNAILEKVVENGTSTTSIAMERKLLENPKGFESLLKIFSQPTPSAVSTVSIDEISSNETSPSQSMHKPLDKAWSQQVMKIMLLANPPVKRLSNSSLFTPPQQPKDISLELNLNCQLIIQQLTEPLKNSENLIKSLKNLQLRMQKLNLKNGESSLPKNFFQCMQALVTVLQKDIFEELETMSKNPQYKIPKNFEQWLQAPQLLIQIASFDLTDNHMGYELYSKSLLTIKKQICDILNKMENTLKQNKDNIVKNAYSNSTKQFYQEKFATFLKIYGPLILAFGNEEQKKFYNENFSKLNSTKEESQEFSASLN